MADEDFSPRDGLSDVWVEFDGLDRHLSSADVHVRFRFVLLKDGREQVLSTLRVPTPAHDDGVSGQIARAHAELIRILRQGIWSLDKMGQTYSRRPPTPADPRTTDDTTDNDPRVDLL